MTFVAAQVQLHEMAVYTCRGGANSAVRLGDADANLELLESLPGKNIAAKAKLLQSYEAEFESWAFELQEGFNLLMYGFGSKKVFTSHHINTLVNLSILFTSWTVFHGSN